MRKRKLNPEYWEKIGTVTQRELDLIPKKHYWGKNEKVILALIKHRKDDWRVKKQLLEKRGYWGEEKEINKSISRQSAVKFIKRYLKKQKGS